MSSPVDYFDLDGEWVQRHPVKMQDATVRGFLLPADMGALQALCRTWINDRPSKGAVQVEPLFPAVILVDADIAQLRSGDPQHGQRGYLHERDVGFFLPIKLHVGGTTKIACLIPYLFVDNVAGIIAGREIYGFPKEWGEISYTAVPFNLVVEALTLPQYGAKQPVVKRPVIEMHAPLFTLGVSLGADIIGAMKALSSALFHALGLDPLKDLGLANSGGFDIIRLLFLKQFRDVATSTRACYQSLVEVVGQMSAFSSASLLVGKFDLTLPFYDQPRIADTLGLKRTTTALLGFSVSCDLTVPLGTVLWEA